MFSQFHRITKLIAMTAFVLISACGPQIAEWQTYNITGYRPDLSFEMISAESGQTVSEADYLGKVVVLNFGFTHCPDVCPISLQQMNSALSLMPKRAEEVVVLFVTVDPERDNLTVLKDYTDSFGPQTVGLFSDEAGINALTARYKVSLGYGEPDENGDYDVSHGQGMTVFDRLGKARLLVRPDHTAEQIQHDLMVLLEEKAL